MKFLGLLISVALLWGGGQTMYTYLNNKEAVEVSIDSLYEEMPDAKWLEIRGCSFSLLDGVYFESVVGDGQAEEIYVPVYSQNQPEEAPVKVVVIIKNKNLLDVYNLFGRLKEEKIMEYLEKYQDQVYQSDVTFRGVVQFGIEMSGKERRQLATNISGIGDDFIVLKANTKPGGVGFSLFMMGLGVLVAVFSIRSFVKK
ncbi:MAG: hypothetical protein OEX02_07185 [Cyclobacteriaceae bacterium]|nr:hypothetical protein [Cyclobacteriaceae bacterium]